MVRAYIGGLLLDGTDNPATYTISEDGLKGWWSGVSSDVPTTKRPQMHGEFQGNGTLDGRLITIEGIIHSVDDQGADINAISSVLADGSLGLLLIEESSGSKWAYVRRVGEPDTKILVYGKTAAYQVRFRARDPRRYSTGEWQSTPPPSPGVGLVFPAVWPAKWPGGGATGRVTLPNNGRAPSPVTLVLNGGFSSALITCVESGARIGFARPIPSGTSVIIQTDDTGVARRATLNGQDVSRWLRYREWTDVPGLMSRTFQLQVTDPVGTPTLAGKVDHAWW